VKILRLEAGLVIKAQVLERWSNWKRGEKPEERRSNLGAVL
jgi:hypothetical protein